jgi:signal transduction histidine kinase
VYRIVQAALTNAGKHGEARYVTVAVIEDDRHIHVTVRDDGHGFDTDAATAGFGLAGISERVKLLSGDLSLVSASGHGTTVPAVLPVVRRDGAESHSASRTLPSCS